MLRFVSIAVCALALGTPALAQTRLSDQQVLGWRRICSFEDLRPRPAGVREDRTYTTIVGRGEPCPFRYAPPPPERPRRPPAPTRTP
jgi:hypothetical protein